MRKQLLNITILTALASSATATAWGKDTALNLPATGSSVANTGEPDLATKLANPLAALISMPVQANFDDHLGFDGQGEKWLVNVQPVIPFALNDDWNIISRTIVPIVDQSNYTDDRYNQSGLSDILQSVWFSPAQPNSNGWIWGVGPAFLFPTASDEFLGAEKWGAGPTAVALKQTGHWTFGALSNHIWSYAGDDDRGAVNSTFIQPFCSYVTDTKTTFTINSESTFDWTDDQWNIPVNFMVAQMLKIGEQPFQVQAGARYWAASPHDDQEGEWGLRFAVTFLFPKG